MYGSAIRRVLVTWLLAIALPVFADVGAIQFVAGEVRIVHADGRETAAAKGVRLFEGDTILTGTNGHAQLLMADEAMISLRPDSTLRFDTYRYAGKEDGSEKGVLGLLKGGFRTLTGLIGRANKSNYLVRTPTATIGIRGTDHEPFFVPLAGWSGAPDAEPGTYNKVNAGSTFIQTEGGRIELSVNQIGFAPPDPKAQPMRLDRIPDFMRPSPMMRGQGERRRPGDGPARGERRGPPPPPGGMLPRGGDIPPFFARLAADGGFDFNQSVADLSPAPPLYAIAGGDRSGAFIGSGTGMVLPTGLFIALDPAGNPALIADTGGGFRYARSGAPLVYSGGTAFTDGGTSVDVKWGIYAGGVIIDHMGPRTSDFFHFMTAQGTPLAVMATLNGTYSTMIGHTPLVTEMGLGNPTYNALTHITLTTGGNVTSYRVKINDDGFSRIWDGQFSGSLPIGQFINNGVPLAGTGPGGAATGSGRGVPVGPTGQGIISSFDMRSGIAGITGAFVVKQ
ncbi:MAG: FecR domain-containing protein [Zoogloeaceae bacterium]|nr:FecR domain-containing protein [Zoogloeaceae bacterium]MCK6384859.1 FecR domain-containing protein [Rhodocyclaceae bacterium]